MASTESLALTQMSAHRGHRLQMQLLIRVLLQSHMRLSVVYGLQMKISANKFVRADYFSGGSLSVQ